MLSTNLRASILFINMGVNFIPKVQSEKKKCLENFWSQSGNTFKARTYHREFLVKSRVHEMLFCVNQMGDVKEKTLTPC
jgi:hypothetical protein